MLIFVKVLSHHITFAVAFANVTATLTIKEFLNSRYMILVGQILTLTKVIKAINSDILYKIRPELCSYDS